MRALLLLNAALCHAQTITSEKFTIPITQNSGAEFTVPRLQPREPPQSNVPFPDTHSLVFKDRKLDRFGFPSLGVSTPVGDSAFEAGAEVGAEIRRGTIFWAS